MSRAGPRATGSARHSPGEFRCRKSRRKRASTSPWASASSPWASSTRTRSLARVMRCALTSCSAVVTSSDHTGRRSSGRSPVGKTVVTTTRAPLSMRTPHERVEVRLATPHDLGLLLGKQRNRLQVVDAGLQHHPLRLQGRDVPVEAPQQLRGGLRALPAVDHACRIDALGRGPGARARVAEEHDALRWQRSRCGRTGRVVAQTERIEPQAHRLPVLRVIALV